MRDAHLIRCTSLYRVQHTRCLLSAALHDGSPGDELEAQIPSGNMVSSLEHYFDFCACTLNYVHSGAGIAGLALATVLGKYEQKESPLEVDIYERHPGITTFGAGISVWQRTWRVMQLLGIDDQLAQASERPPKREVGE